MTLIEPAVRFMRSDLKGKPIEGNGNEPDVIVSPTIADFLAGKDPVLERAAAMLGQKVQSKQGAVPAS